MFDLFDLSVFRAASPNQLPEHQMCEEDLRAEAMVFTSAALEGVAAFISPLIDNITQNPEVYVKVRTEIENFEAKGLMSSPVVKFEETNNLSFFMACVYETLRHDAPAPLRLRGRNPRLQYVDPRRDGNGCKSIYHSPRQGHLRRRCG